MKGSNSYTLVYAAALGVAASILMTGVGYFTAPLKDANAKADKMRNVLAVLEVPMPPKASAQELVKIFEQNVRVEEGGKIVKYVYAPAEDASNVKAVAVPLDGAGLWGPIQGFLALEPDMHTIRGLTFYHQEETPGLGGEIGAAGFRSQFRGKSIRSSTGAWGIRIMKQGAAASVNEVDGITGATMTCNKLAGILNETIKQVSEEAP